MLDNYFCAPKTLRRLRAGPSGPYIDGFADALERDGYVHASAVRYLRAPGPMSTGARWRHSVATLPAVAVRDRTAG
jgi:hypothetical protein